MRQRMDGVVMESGRAWWDRVSQQAASPLELDGYGQVAVAGGEKLLRAMTDDVRQKLELSGQTTLLEVGCGAGAITRGLADGTRATVGADFSWGMVAQARQLAIARTRFCVSEAAHLPFSSGCFDRVLCYSVFNNFPSLEYARRAIHELVRVARPEGIVLIGQVPNAQRKEEWFRAYAARFGNSSAPNRLRSALGSMRHSLGRVIRTTLALAGRKPPAALHFLYYSPRFFQQALLGTSHRCEIMPACDLLREEPGSSYHRDYRLDVRIRVG